MENQIIFIPHKIEGEEDLPKETGNYIFISDKLRTDLKFYSDHDLKWWVNTFDYWLEEVPVPTDEEMAYEMIARYINNTGQFRKTKISLIKKAAFADGINWFKSQLKLK